ncbi:hypothetical protein SDC9_129268 [bioreactor metagenome]|uniref:Uncharacterized protein n=1 Tax=bioreactor metagenome TaxID=1076179 RepID=A0A645CZ54_9ZZZZ
MHRVLVGETEVLGEKTAYYLLDNTDGFPGDYGVEIVRGSECSRVNGLAPSGDRVWRLAELLVQCAVTPVTLRDVTEDWLLC